MINITYAALHVRAETEKTTFSCKDDCTLTKHTRRWTDFFCWKHFWFLSKKFLEQIKFFKSILPIILNYSMRGCERNTERSVTYTSRATVTAVQLQSISWTQIYQHSSSMKVSFLGTWVPGASTIFCQKTCVLCLDHPGTPRHPVQFFVKIPVCSALITQVSPPSHPF